ncbi:MAG: AAA family ATPase [Pseudomonadota bacterium]|nr:AAA family ATPase [Pseudomonadota bacterium]
MKIRSLTLENVRKFGGKRVSIDGIGDGISVISEANEFGKSTFFDALHALFFEKYSSTKKPIKSLQPHAGGGVEIAATVEVDGTLYAVEKRFLAKKGASVTDVAATRVIARDDEAEAWISEHIGQADAGPAGLLWVRQGVLGLEPADIKPAERDQLTEARRDLLSSVAGEIDQVTGGRTMDRILKRCEDDLGALATGAQQRPRGPWKDAVDAEAALTAELAELDSTCNALATALDERRAIDAELSRLADPAAIEARKTDRDAAQRSARAAEDHARQLDAAKSAHALAVLELKEATRLSGDFAQAVASVDTARKALAGTTADHDAARSALTAAETAEKTARSALETAEADTRQCHDAVRLAERQAAADRARGDLERLEATHAKARDQVKSRAAARARLADNSATPDALAKAEAAARNRDRLAAALSARQAAVTVAYTASARILRDGTELPEGARIALADGDVLDIPALGTLRFTLPDTQGADTAADLTGAEARLRDALAACGATTLDDAHARAAARKADQDAIDLAETTLSLLAPQGIDALETALAEARAVVAQAPDGPARDADEAAQARDDAVGRETQVRQAHATARETLTEARLAAAQADTAHRAAREAVEEAERRAGPQADRAAREDTLAAIMRTAETKARELDEAAKALAAEAPDLETARANLTRAEAAYEAGRKRLETLGQRRAALSAQIETRAEEGVEERRAEVAERLAEVSARAARYGDEVASLSLLRDTLLSARAAARDAYFEPVQTELAPLLGILHDDARIDWESESIVPGALHRDGESEAFDTLSGGTQEQIAILTRLAFARLFARRGDHVPVILDDALVYSDDDRIIKMFTALNRVAANQQIIVFSCRQLAFAGLGGDRPQISVSVPTGA